jgi:hypothetical protein
MRNGEIVGKYKMAGENENIAARKYRNISERKLAWHSYIMKMA